jgi:ribosomal protein S1
MAKGIVEGLEIIEVDKEESPLAVGARACDQGLAQPLHEQAAVGQMRQGVIKSEIPDLLFGGLGGGDISGDRENA